MCKKRAKDIMDTSVLSAYEGWSVSRLENFLGSNDLGRAPVIASDHQLVGTVGINDIYCLMSGDKSYRAKLLNDSFLRNCSQELFRSEDLMQWDRKANVYCTVHQIMSPVDNCVEEEDSISTLLMKMTSSPHQVLWVVSSGILVGQVKASSLIEILQNESLSVSLV